MCYRCEEGRLRVVEDSSYKDLSGITRNPYLPNVIKKEHYIQNFTVQFPTDCGFPISTLLGISLKPILAYHLGPWLIWGVVARSEATPSSLPTTFIKVLMPRSHWCTPTSFRFQFQLFPKPSNISLRQEIKNNILFFFREKRKYKNLFEVLLTVSERLIYRPFLENSIMKF